MYCSIKYNVVINGEIFLQTDDMDNNETHLQCAVSQVNRTDIRIEITKERE